MTTSHAPTRGAPIRPGIWPTLALALASLAAVLIVQAAVGPRSSVADQPFVPLVLGTALALITGFTTRTAALHLGIAAMIGFPLWAIGDLLLHPGPHDGPDHGLLPIELFVYACYMALACGVAMTGRAMRKSMARRA